VAAETGSEREDGGNVFRRAVVEIRLKELDAVVSQLDKYRHLSPAVMAQDLEKRWAMERGLEAGAQLILEIADNILSNQFGHYSETYENALSGLFEMDVISEGLYLQIKGLGGLRNILVHQYIQIDLDLVFNSLLKSLKIFPLFAREISIWMEEMEQRSGKQH
jgi:uncharacterized protein YutE (UPF0331/DUF86 family)